MVVRQAQHGLEAICKPAVPLLMQETRFVQFLTASAALSTALAIISSRDTWQGG